MRAAPTASEALLWLAVRGGQLGVVFRRQVVVGRFIVDMPDGGVPGDTWGGAALAPNATSETGSQHTLTGTVTTVADDIGLADGCCANGYALAGTSPFSAVTGAEPVHFPYLMASLCSQI